jgi:hypothetical protein
MRRSPSPPTPRAGLSPAVWSAIAAVLVGLALRVWILTGNSGLTMDSPLYVNMAEAIARGESAPGPAHHGYSLLIALAHLAIPGRELPARMVSLLAGMVLLPLVWALARRSLPDVWASLAVWLTALHPLLALFSGAILTESAFIVLLYGALMAIERRRAIAGALLGLAFVVRPEALVIAPVAALLSGGGRRGFWLVLGGFALVAAPYLGYLRWERGEWSLGPKTALVRPMFENPRQREWHVAPTTGERREEPRALPERIVWAAPSIARHYLPNLVQHLRLLLWTWPVPLLLASALGLTSRRWWLLAPLTPLLFLPLLSVAFDLRFPQPFVPALAVLAAQGLAWGVARLGAREWPRAAAGTLAAVGVILLWTGPAGRSVFRFDDGPMPQMREAGAWLAAHGKPGAIVMDRKAYVPFFAGMRHVQLPDDDYDSLVTFAQRTGVDYLVIEEYLVPGLRPQLLPLVQDRAFRLRERRLVAAYVTGEVPGTGVAVFEVRRDSLAIPRREE